MAPRLLIAALALVVLAPDRLAAQRPDTRTVHQNACDQGDLRSCSVLGLIYETGAAGVRDLGRATGLYERACAREVEAACHRLELLREAGPTPVPEGEFFRTGHVADADSGAPIAQVLVELPRLGIRRMSDERGYVDLGELPRGAHRIVARRLGFESVEGVLPVPWSTDFLLLMNQDEVDESPALGGVFGQVTDAATGAPLANVDVVLLAPNPVRTITNGQGRFGFGGVTPGAAEVRLSLIGYDERRRELDIQAGRTVEVYATLSARAIELEPIVVTVGSSYLQRSGFFRRARAGAGYVLTRADVTAGDPILLSEMFRRVPGVYVEQTRQGARVVSNREVARDRPGACQLRSYLDGVPVIDFDVDGVRPEDVDGLEIYQGLAAPIEYRNLVNPDGTRPCGVVLIWTTRGGL